MPKIFEIAVYGAEGNARLHRSQRREPRRGEVVALRTGQRHASAVPRRRLPRNTSATQSFVGHSPHRFPSRAPCMRSEEHTSELQSLMRISYAVFCLKKKTDN